jgi:hypothetical protein
LNNGTATFSDFSVRVPGASVLLSGTYSLLNLRINLQGPMRMDASLSHATTGVNSVLVKVLAPVIRQGKSNKVVPVRISGTYEHPSYGLALGAK